MRQSELRNWLAVLEELGAIKEEDRWHTVELKGKMVRERVVVYSDGMVCVRVVVRGGRTLKPTILRGSYEPKHS